MESSGSQFSLNYFPVLLAVFGVFVLLEPPAKWHVFLSMWQRDIFHRLTVHVLVHDAVDWMEGASSASPGCSEQVIR